MTWTPGPGHRLLRFATQLTVFALVVVAPLLGGWHRLERSLLSAWHGWGHDLPAWAMDRLPRGETAEGVYAWLGFIGGGGAIDLAGVPAVDPVAGLAAILTGSAGWTAVGAWLIPVGLAVLFGRVWCGWMCPFGTLSRAVEGLRRYLPGKYRGWRLPPGRPLRWVLLGGSLVLGAVGFPGLMYLALPHVLLQHSLYSAWLLGGGGAALGAVAGLVVAGLVFGPTIYCAALCPTGAALRALSLGRLVRVAIADKPACGASCTQCDAACWLGLTPSTGDPGPDCDLCARCFGKCPKTNLRLTARRAPEATATVAALAFMLLAPAGVRADEPPGASRAARPMQTKPLLLLEASQQVDDVTAAVSVIDWTGVRLSQDDVEAQTGVEISVFVSRGEPGERDARGKQTPRVLYEGPLTMEVRNPRGEVVETLTFERPNEPRSASIAAVFRQRIDRQLPEGSTVEVTAIDGWLPRGVRWQVQPLQAGTGWRRAAMMGGAAFLVAVGLLSLALGIHSRRFTV